MVLPLRIDLLDHGLFDSGKSEGEAVPLAPILQEGPLTRLATMTGSMNLSAHYASPRADTVSRPLFLKLFYQIRHHEPLTASASHGQLIGLCEKRSISIAR